MVQQYQKRVLERLDKFATNYQWQMLFLDAYLEVVCNDPHFLLKR